jgi:hypothetical protein
LEGIQRENEELDALSRRGGHFVFATDLVRSLCSEITAEKDPEKTEELLSLLQAVIKEELEDARARLEFIRQEYASAISESNAAD